MSFETLILEPASGHVDVIAVRDWLNAAPFTHLVQPDTWQISATSRLAVLARLDREAGEARVPLGVVVWIDPERIGMNAYADNGAMARTRDFVRWLVHGGQWTVKVDRAPLAPLVNVDDIFGDDLPATDTLLDDLTSDPVVMGTLTRCGVQDHQLHIHSSGQLRFEAPERTIRGELDTPTLALWNEAVMAVDMDDPALPDNPPEDRALTIEIETPDHSEFAMLDSARPPASMKALCSLARGWMKALTNWNGEIGVAGLIQLRIA